MVPLDILSDPICPWCYIGKAHLEKALAERPDHPFVITWRPFQLNPDMPRAGMDRQAYLEAKFGGAEGAAEVYGRIAEAAEAAGLKLDFAGIARTPNTLDAHRLIHWAFVEDCQQAVVDALFKAYFEEGLDLGDRDILADVADGAGMDASVVHKLLASDADLEDIRAQDAAFRDMGVTGVPTFLVNQAHAVPGSQPAELWLQVIDELTTRATAEAQQM
ncbi:MAG: DsbA family oxidoreductase [Pseudomonadota bacterium]